LVCGSGFASAAFVFLWSAAVLCSAALVFPLSPVFLWSAAEQSIAVLQRKTEEKHQKQKRQSKALPHSKKGQKSSSVPID